jgi:diacylglycerol O-acyltransferase
MRAQFLPFVDQGMYLAHSIGGQQAVVQVLWFYRRAADLEGLRRFHENLAHGRLARLIRPALLPFGRPQWASAPPPQMPLSTAIEPIAPEAVRTWADAQLRLPMDPVHGPAWTFTVQPLTDRSMAVSLVISHCIADGMAMRHAIIEAARGERFKLPYPNLSEHSLYSTLAEELLRAAKDTSSALRALAQLVRIARAPPVRNRTKVAVPKEADSYDREVIFPTCFLRIPLSDWDEKSRDLGSSRFTLLIATTAAFARALGRVNDGHVSVRIPVNQREGLSDIGANRVSIATLKIPVEALQENFRMAQREWKLTLLRTRREPDPIAALLPLVPFLPKRLFSVAGNLALGTLGERPVTCSYLGPLELLAIDGAESDLFCFRGIDRPTSARRIDARQGVATLHAADVDGHLNLTFTAYEPGLVTEYRQLREVVETLLGTYGLKGEFLLPDEENTFFVTGT